MTLADRIAAAARNPEDQQADPPPTTETPRQRGPWLRGFLVGLPVGAIGLFGAVGIGLAIFAPSALGDDPRIDELYSLCEAGQMAACDLLDSETAPGSELQEFGHTCGDRVANPDSDYCTNIDPEADAHSLSRR